MPYTGIGIHTLADLAETTPVDLAQKLSAQAGLKLSAEAINGEDLIGQALSTGRQTCRAYGPPW